MEEKDHMGLRKETHRGRKAHGYIFLKIIWTSQYYTFENILEETDYIASNLINWDNICISLDIRYKERKTL